MSIERIWKNALLIVIFLLLANIIAECLNTSPYWSIFIGFIFGQKSEYTAERIGLNEKL